MLNAMGEIQLKLNKRQPLIDTLLKKTQPAKVKPKTLQLHNKELNKYQKEAVEFTVAAPVISLIHGPPGNSSCTITYCMFTI
jgi:hypothetical protein